MKKLLYILPTFASFSLFAAEGTKKGGGYMQTLIMLGVALFFFYFILLRPEQKRRKQSQKMRNEMKKGDKITAMGLLGTIDKVNDNTVILKAYDGAKLEILKAAITDVKPSGVEVESSS